MAEMTSIKGSFLALGACSQSWKLNNLWFFFLVKLTGVTSCLLQFDRNFFCSNNFSNVKCKVSKDLAAKKVTIFNLIVHLVKTSENILFFFPAFYLVMWLMISPKNFEKIAILKIWELISLFGEIPLK